jgi:hypothetical protein
MSDLTDIEAMERVQAHCPGLPIGAGQGGQPLLVVNKGNGNLEKFTAESWEEASQQVIDKYAAKPKAPSNAVTTALAMSAITSRLHTATDYEPEDPNTITAAPPPEKVQIAPNMNRHQRRASIAQARKNLSRKKLKKPHSRLKSMVHVKVPKGSI